MNGTNDRNPVPKTARLWFGIFMILIYLGVGLMFIFNVFNIDNRAISCTIGGLLIAYGIFRGYRLYIGSN